MLGLRPNARWPRALTVALALPLLACGDDPTTTPPDAPSLEPICLAEAKPWTSGETAFVDATEAWGLSALAVRGVRISAVDFDGDGWPDIIARRTGSNPDDLWTGDPCCATASCADGVTCPVRRTWLLRNNRQGGFEDVTVSSGLIDNRTATDPDLGRPGEVYAFGDVDNDGDLDAYVGLGDVPGEMQPETSELLLNNGDGTFSLGPAESPIRVPAGDVPSGAAFVDYDRNGLLDIFVSQNSFSGQPRQDQMYWGDGTGGFVNVTEGVGLITEPWNSTAALNEGRAHSNAWSALACDLDGDGTTELLAASYGRAPNHLWRGLGPDGEHRFENLSVASGYAFDERNDWSDNESARCHCTLHPDDEDCAGVPAPMYIQCNVDADAFRWNHATDREAFRLGGNSGATMCGDIDNDGDMDLMTTEIVHWDVGSSSDPTELLFNDGTSPLHFSRPGGSMSGVTWEHTILAWNDGVITGALFDFDNDGWLDVYVGNSEYPGAKGELFHQLAAGSFEQVPYAEGIDHNRSHGVAIADFDRDGDLDIVVGHSRSRCGGETDCYPTAQMRLFENQAGASGNWVQLQLVGGPGTNRAAIGARVTIEDENGIRQTQEVGGGHGHYGSQNDLTLHFGLGSACRAKVTVRWPDLALTEQTVDLVSGYRFRLEQGSTPEVVERETEE